MDNFIYIGKNLKRPDAISKVTGRAIFLDDIKIPNMLHAAILTPPYAHAKILSIDTTDADKSEGVVKVVTGKNCKFTYGDCIRDRFPMAVDKVRYIGEPVAAVIADTYYHAKQAVKKIKVEYEKLPVYIDALDALKDDSALIHEKNGEYWHLPSYKPIPKTNIANYYVLKKGNFEEALKEAEVVVEGEFNYKFGSSSAIEPHGAIVWFHEDNTIEVWSSSICPAIIQDDLARTYGLPAANVRVHIPEIGGCFGYKSDVTIEQTVAYIASHVKGYPVKWVATRKDDYTSTLIGHGVRIKMKIGAKKDGKLVFIQSKVYHSTGAYADTGVNITMAATHTVGVYEFPYAFCEGYTVYTNTPPVGAFRGYGYQYAHFAIERLMDMLVRKLDMDIFELREKNYLTKYKKFATGEVVTEDYGDIKKCSDTIKNIIFDKEKLKEDENYFYGRGFAAVVKAPKGAPHSSKGCYVKFNGDGSVSVNMGGAEVGQGLRTVVQQIAAETLKIQPEKIRVYTEIDTQYSPWEWQTIGSMFTVQGGRALIRACQRAIDKLIENASFALRVDKDMLEYDGEKIYLKHNPNIFVKVIDLVRGYMHEDGITVGEVVQATSDARLPRYSNPDPETGQGNLGVSYTFGAQGCKIRIDKKTGEIIIDNFASAFDIGKVINPVQLRGQIVGGVMIGIGATLYEELKFDKDGRLINPHFSTYKFPTIKEMPKKYEVVFIETPESIGPYGARGIGEHPVLGVAPAILNAIYDAIGVDLYEVPVSKEKILELIKDKIKEKTGV